MLMMVGGDREPMFIKIYLVQVMLWFWVLLMVFPIWQEES